MGSICGIADFSEKKSLELKDKNNQILEKMGEEMRRRGPDQKGSYISIPTAGTAAYIGLQHNRLAVIDIQNGTQPMHAQVNGNRYTLVYNGELYNTKELKRELRDYFGYDPFQTESDTEAVLYAYIAWGQRCPIYLNGIFSFAIYAEGECSPHLFLARDRLGVKPLFYTWTDGGQFLFASEIKALLKHPQVKHEIDQIGMWQLFFLTPVTLNGSGIFKNIFELLPGEAALLDCSESHPSLKKHLYWSLQAVPFHEGKKDTVEHVRYLLEDAVERQLISDVPLCVLLSGGLDSSVISAIAARFYQKRGIRLPTYSFEYEGNRENFHSTFFQPQGDDKYAVYLADYLHTEHRVLTASTEEVAKCLSEAVMARDFPGQADIDSSLLYFCRQIKKKYTVALSGECADEIFGGYPWFYRTEMLDRDFFPWIHVPFERIGLLREELSRAREGYAYLADLYHREMELCPLLDTDSSSMQTSRRATWLSAKYFMMNLLERKDRMSMYSALEVRVPFADHRILEYVYNIPWEYKYDTEKYKETAEKSLLRNAVRDLLPEKILWRKKSPYPKTHNPNYEILIRKLLSERLRKPTSRLREWLDPKKLRQMEEGDDIIWLGQLMSRPQLLAWLYQLDIWLEAYEVNLIV